MRPLLYLVGATLKNRMLELVKKPSRIIYTVVLLALLVFTMTAGGHTSAANARDANELIALVVAFYTVMFLMTANAGFSRGGNLFTLSDVTMLFTSPIRSQTILFYGLLRQMGMSLLVGFFLLFQYANLKSFYNITIGEMVGLLVGYAASIFLGQLAAMVLYAFSSHDARRKLLCRVALVGVFALCAAWLAVGCLPGGQAGLAARAVELSTGGFLYALPVGGWLGLAAKGMLGGGAALVLQGAGLCVVSLALLVFLLFRVNADYYEDVLKSAEISYSAIAAKKEGTMSEALPIHIKLGKTGLGGGWGGSAFFRKHLLENRRSRKFILPTNGLLFAAITVGFSLFMRDNGIFPVFVMATYLQLFTAMMTGRFNYELMRPYLYLVPEPALKKLLWALAETLPAMVLDALVVFLPVCVILESSSGVFAAAVLARVSFGVAYLAADVAVERIWGGSISKVLVMLLYLVIALAIMIPGIVLAFVTTLTGGGTAGALLATAVGNLPVSVLVLFLCRNLLECAELSNQ